MYEMMNQILVVMSLVMFVFTSVMYGLNLYVDYRDRKNIHVLQSKVSILKLMLKSKMKSLDVKFQKHLKKFNQDDVKSLFDKLAGIKNLDLKQPTDYSQLVIFVSDLNKEVERLSAVKADEAELNQKSSVDWEKLMQFDRRLVVLLYEIVNHSQIVNSAITIYNEGQKKPKKQFKPEAQIVLPEYDVLHTIMTEMKLVHDPDHPENESKNDSSHAA